LYKRTAIYTVVQTYCYLYSCTNGFVVYNIQYSNCNVYSSFTSNIFRVHIRYENNNDVYSYGSELYCNI